MYEREPDDRRLDLIETQFSGVCTENSSSGVAVMKSAKDGV
jgi:hypothetical protein